MNKHKVTAHGHFEQRRLLSSRVERSGIERYVRGKGHRLASGYPSAALGVAFGQISPLAALGRNDSRSRMGLWPMRFSLIILLAMVFMALGCQSQDTKQSLSRLAMAKRLYDQRQYHQAEKTLSPFILESNSNAATLCEAYYLRGLCRRHQGAARDPMAEKDFTQAIERSCHRTIKGLAHVGLGHLYFEQGLTALNKAKYHYLAALDLLDDAAPKDAVLYRLGVTMQRLGHWLQADRYLQRCANHFSSSDFAPQAQRRIGAKTFRLQAGAFSKLSRATKKIGQLQQSGWPFDSTSKTINGKALYFVRSGWYPTYKMALSQLKRLAAAEPDAMIVVSP